MSEVVWKSAKDSNGRLYYYNSQTGESRWDKPLELYTEQESILYKHGWKASETADGKVYFYNSKTKESRWDMPTFGSGNETPETKQQPLLNEMPGTEILDDNEKYANTSKILNPPKKSKEEAEKEFIEMLRDNQVDSTWSFGKIISLLGAADPRYWMVDDDPLWKQQIFEKYLTNRTEDQLLKEHTEIHKFKEAFWEMLRSKPQIRYYTRWPTVRRLIANEPIYKHSVMKESLKKKSFLEYVTTLKEKHKNEQIELKEQALKELREYLESIIFSPEAQQKNNQAPILSWQALLNSYLFDKNKRFVANKHFKNLTHEDILQVYLQLVETESRKLQTDLLDLQKKNYTKDRIARDNYKLLLRSNEFQIRANSKWQDVYPKLKNDPRFLRMLGTGGSSALDLFLDVVEEKSITANAHRSIAQTLLIDKEFEWKDNADDDRTSIRSLLTADARFKEVDQEDIDFIVELLINLRKDKQREQMEIERRIWNQKKHLFEIMLQRFYRGARVIPQSWEDARAALENTVEYKELGDNEQVRRSIFEKFKTTTPGSDARIDIVQPSPSNRKRPLTPAIELDY